MQFITLDQRIAVENFEVGVVYTVAFTSGINVPTTDGLNVFDISTTLKPSEVYLKYFSPLF